jgi:hypothetical protein
VTGVGEKSAREARSWRDTNAFAQTSLDEKKSDTRMHSAIARAMKGESDSKSPCATRALSSLVHRVSSIDDLPAFAGEETTEPCVSATTVDVSSGRQPTLPW